MGGQRIKRDHGRASPAHLDSQEPAKIPGLILCSPRPPPAVRVLREWEGGKGSKSKGQTSRTGTPEGWLGEGRSSYTQWDPPTVRGPAGIGETLGEMVGEGHKGTEENAAGAFPVHVGMGLPGLMLCPRRLPPAAQSPGPAPTCPPRAPPLRSETPSNVLGLNPTHTPSSGPYLQTPELHTPDVLLSTYCLSPSAQVLSRGPAPCSNVTPPPA